MSVAPYTGAWIEIALSWLSVKPSSVAPYTGAWIEIASFGVKATPSTVAPYTGAWIEIVLLLKTFVAVLSLLIQERGLKLD